MQKVKRGTILSYKVVGDDIEFRMSITPEEEYSQLYRIVVNTLVIYELDNDIISNYKKNINSTLTIKKLGLRTDLADDIVMEYFEVLANRSQK